jgi:NADH pyrophosphatase NudC (nudix superfamily)
MGDFFQKVKQGIGKGVTTASVKSKEVLETTKTKSQINGLQEQKKALLEELGNNVYTMFLEGGFDEEGLKTKCPAIAALDGEIKSKEQELKEVHMKAQEALGKPKPIGICTCGEEIYESTKFCGKCGKKVSVLAV